MAYGGFPAIFSGYRQNCENRMPIWCIEAEKWNCLDQQMTFRGSYIPFLSCQAFFVQIAKHYFRCLNVVGKTYLVAMQQIAFI